MGICCLSPKQHIKKRKNLVNLPLHSEMNIRMLIVNEIKEKVSIPFRVEKKCRPHNDDSIKPGNPYTVATRSSRGDP